MEKSNLIFTSSLDNNNQKFEISYFYNLDSENKICFDCGGAFPRFASINNGVFICELCAENHKKNLNYNISFIYDISLEFDQYLLSFITRGGNSRFKRLCNQYEVPCMSLSQNNSEKINKYVIRLGEYHRLLLKSEIDCSEPPPPLYREVAHNPIDVNIIYFPEFENYHLFQGNNISLNNNKKIKNNNEVNNNENNVEDSMASKIWEGTKNTFDVMKTTTGFIYNTSKPIVSFIGNAAFTGLKYIGNSVWNYYMNNNENKVDIKDKNVDTIGNNTPLYDNERNYNNNNNNVNINNNDNNIFHNNNLNYNNYNANHNYPMNKNYMTNSNKFTIFTINENDPYNNINNNMNKQNNFYSKPNQELNNGNKSKINNQIPIFYDINSINNESINNISFYLNNNNNNNNSINDISRIKNNLLNHENIIINDKYINHKEIMINNNNIISDSPDLINKNIKNINNKNLPNNDYPNYSLFEKNMIFNKNIPNIVGQEIFQEKDIFPNFQSTNLLNENTFLPSEYNTNNDK